MNTKVARQQSKKNIYFFNFSFELNSVFLPYVYGCLRAHADTIPELVENYHWAEVFYLMEDPKQLLAKIVDPEIIAFSSYTWNIQKNLFFSKKLKKLYPDALIIFGGPQVPNTGTEFMEQHPWIDICVHNEGEIPFSEILLENLKTNHDWSKITGISYRPQPISITKNILTKIKSKDSYTKKWKNTFDKITKKTSTVLKTKASERLPREINIPSPYLTGYYDKIIQKLHQERRKITVLWETNRGCPYRCAFCDWGNGLTASKTSYFPEERLLREIDWFAEKKIYDVHNTDSNYGVFPRDLKLVQKLAEKKQATGSPKIFAATFAKNSNEKVLEISKIIQNNKMSYGTTLSVQAMNENVLAAISRKNIGTQKYIELKNLYEAASIPTYSEIILGLPEESWQSFRRGFDQLMQAGLHEGIMVHPLGLFPNAPLNQKPMREKYQIQTISRPIWYSKQFDRNELQEKVDFVVQTSTMSPSDWLEMMNYGNLISVFHGGGLTRFLARFLQQTQQLSYYDFYTSLYDFYATDSNSVLGKSILFGRKRFTEILENPQANCYGYKEFSLEYKNQKYKLKGSPHNYMWLYPIIHIEKLFQEIEFILEKQSVNTTSTQLQDCIKFQKEIMLQPSYDPTTGKFCSYDFNWHEHFFHKKDLVEKEYNVHYQDTHMGMHHDMALKKDDIEAFRWSSQAPNGARPRHYMHQLDRATFFSAKENISSEIQDSAHE